MKRARVDSRPHAKRKKTREPLAEGIVPSDKRSRRSWASMSNEQLMDYAKKFMKENGISGKMELKKASGGLYPVLLKRKLLDRVGFEEKIRNWSSLSTTQLIEHARQLMEEKGISGRAELRKADSGLYHVLLKRKLLDRVGFEEKIRNWSSLSTTQLIEHARQLMKEKGISGRKKLRKADSGLYHVLLKRKLLDRVGFEEKRRKQRDWNSLSTTQLIEHAKQFMKKKRISGRRELQKADIGLYKVLLKRKLLDRVGFEEKRRKERPWITMSDDKLVIFAKKFMKKNKISGKNELSKADKGLYETLRKRKLLDRVGFEEKIRNWSSFSDAQLIEHAKQFMEEKGISSRKKLYKADSGLYHVLRKRKLLDRVFEDIEQAKEREEAQALFDGLMEFGGAE